MSRHETWRTRKFWKTIGGLLIEEFLAIPLNRAKGIGKRLIDGVIVLNEKNGIQVGGTYDLIDKDIIVIQTKAKRLGMYLMGQAFFSREIMHRYNPKSIRTVVICAKGDAEMEQLCEKYNIEVVVISDNENDHS